MTRQKQEPRLYGAAEAAEALGVLQQNLRSIPGLPEPYQKIRSTTLWRADEIDALARKRGGPRRKPKRVKAAA